MGRCIQLISRPIAHKQRNCVPGDSISDPEIVAGIIFDGVHHDIARPQRGREARHVTGMSALTRAEWERPYGEREKHDIRQYFA